jgi:hypothetical protein
VALNAPALAAVGGVSITRWEAYKTFPFVVINFISYLVDLQWVEKQDRKVVRGV